MALVCSLYIVNNLLILPSPCRGNSKQQGHTHRHTPLSSGCIESVWSQLLSQQLFHIISFLLVKISLVKAVERDDVSWIWYVKCCTCVCVCSVHRCVCCPLTLLKSRLSCLPEPWYPPWDRKSLTCSWTCSSSRCQQFSSSTLAPAVGSGAPIHTHSWTGTRALDWTHLPSGRDSACLRINWHKAKLKYASVHVDMLHKNLTCILMEKQNISAG